MHLDPSTVIAIRIIILLLFVALNGFFVAAEFALVKIRETQLEPLMAKGNRRARIAGKILGNLDACLSATQLGITFASLGLGWAAGPLFAALLTPVFDWLGIASPWMRNSVPVGVGFVVISFLHIVVGELAPKSMAIQRPLQTSLWVAEPLFWFYRITYPAIWLLNRTSLWLLRQVGLTAASESELHHSAEELRLLITASEKRSGGVKMGRSIVLNAMDLRHRVARDVMRPRKEIVVLDTEASMTECLEVAEKTRYSRFPLCVAGDVDRTLGVVHFKDLTAYRGMARKGADLASVMRKLIYVPETAQLERLLERFLERKLHLAIVIDEHGGTVGLVTLENILEELVGQIQDEFDQEKPLLLKTGDHSWAIDGALPLHQLEELTGEKLEGEGITTTSGWVTHRMGGFPKPGDRVAVGNFELAVLEMDGLRVSHLELKRATQPVLPDTSGEI